MSRKLVIGYAGGNHLKDIATEDVKSLDVINIAFGNVTKEYTIVYGGIETAEQIKRLKAINPDIKIVMSIGGWSAGGFSEMAQTVDTRAVFVKSSLEWVAELGLDGIDLDWEYPCYTVAGIGGGKEDKKNFTALLKELREAFDKVDEKLMLTIAAGGAEYYLRGVEMEEVIKYLDYVQLMTYDLRGGFQVLTGHHTSLYEAEVDLFRASVDSAVKDFMGAGVPKEKIVIGVAFYGRTWKGVPNVDNGLIQMAQTTGSGGPDYGAIVGECLDKKGFVRYFDDVAKAPYLYNGDEFISYDDEESIKHKADYVNANDLLGMMYWEYKCDTTGTLTQHMRKVIDNK